MRLRNPLDSILDKPAKVRLLRILVSPGLELTGRELASEAKASPASSARALRELVETGLVEMRRKGRANLYLLRREGFLIARGLVPLFKSERSLFAEAIRYLRARFERRVVSAVLFGSYARGAEDHRSDVDILLLVRGKREAELLESDVLRAASEFQRRFGAPVAPYVKTVDAFESMLAEGVPLAKQILVEGKDLFGRRLREVLRGGSRQASRA